MKRLPIHEIIRRVQAGESIRSLCPEYKVTRKTMLDQLHKADYYAKQDPLVRKHPRPCLAPVVPLVEKPAVESQPVLEAVDPVVEMAYRQKQIYQDCYDDFSRIFGRSLQGYWDFQYCLFGFDVFKFDTEFLKTPDGVSVQEAVLAKYGQEGVDLIARLIG